MRRSTAFFTLSILSLATAAGEAQTGRPGGRGGRPTTTIQQGESCPEGTTEIRPRSCMAPDLPVPSIVDYRPRSTLVVPTHFVRRAKYPAIDFHGHPEGLLESADGLATLGAALDSLNVRVMVAADNLSGDRLQRAVAAIRASPKMKDRVRVLAGIDFRNVGPGWAEKAIAQLQADLAAGAVGVGEISKSLGIGARRGDGTRLHIDDPDLDPIWDACARLNLTVFIHTADPQEFFEPIDFKNERWLELSLFTDRRYPPDRFPKFEELMAERDRMFKKHPNT
ncbi:MAG TPA: amidohydrolase family protein, partial [Gemmatimonadaceae bacterium]|nr:amidohydrolase family protein [Gemmatimonadaceae bacterium]